MMTRRGHSSRWAFEAQILGCSACPAAGYARQRRIGHVLEPGAGTGIPISTSAI